MIRAGEGPAFLSFHARDTAALHAALRARGYAFRDRSGLTDLPSPPFGFLFWIADNRSPTDRPEHFAHPNGATALRAVWIATDHGDALAGLLVALGGRQERREVLAPDSVDATVVTLAEGDVYILPAHHQLLPGRPIIGASFRARDLATVRRALAAGRIPRRAGLESAERLLVEPSKAHGLWLEFVGPPSAPAAGRYLVTSTPIDVGLGNTGLCVAVDPRDPQGVWWWQPGASGCTSRSTGPQVFHADKAAVSPAPPPEAMAVSFRLGLQPVRPPTSTFDWSSRTAACGRSTPAPRSPCNAGTISRFLDDVARPCPGRCAAAAVASQSGREPCLSSASARRLAAAASAGGDGPYGSP